MNNFDIKHIDKTKPIHFIGVGGVSMSALAQILLSKGYAVSGSDMNASAHIDDLISMGLHFHRGHHSENVNGTALVVYTAAIAPTNPEMVRATEQNIPILKRSQLLGQIMSEFETSVAVSGTHGKTTVTSMLSHVALAAKVDPTILVGADLDIIDGNLRIGHSSYFLAEACEYHRSFLDFAPYCAIILNVDVDHLDYFKDQADYDSAYIDFVSRIDPNGFVLTNGDDPDCMRIVSDAKCKVVPFGLGDDCRITAKNICSENGQCQYDLFVDGNFVAQVSLGVDGMHNVLNSLSALGCGYMLGLDMQTICTSLVDFHGAKRRFEYKGTCNGAKVYDDYAHHPAEINVTLDTAARLPYGRVVCVFQPHTYSRTKSLFDEFVTALSGANEVILVDIYAAREQDDDSIHSRMLTDAICKNGATAQYCDSFASAAQTIKSMAKPNDVILLVGAGDIVKLSSSILDQ